MAVGVVGNVHFPMSSHGATASLHNELVELLGAPLQFHRQNISARHPDIAEVLSGQRGLVLYPAARMASSAARLLRKRGAKVIGFSDKDSAKWGSTIDGLPVIPPCELAERPSLPGVLIASTLHDSSIREYLQSLGCEMIYSTPFLNYCFPEAFVSREYSKATESPYRSGARDSILRLFDALTDDDSRQVLVAKIHYYLSLNKALLDGILSQKAIYFDLDIVSVGDSEIVVDAGAFDGDTLQQFRAISMNRFRKYYAFEPDPIAFGKLQEQVESDDRVVVSCAGVSEKSGTLAFAATGTADGAIAFGADATALSVRVVSLDAYFADKEAPTFIKMDIEGSEVDAVRGARRLITRHRPILAVSAYHHPSDLWEIPLLLLELTPDARIYLRHYTREIDDTVCYALPGGS